MPARCCLRRAVEGASGVPVAEVVQGLRTGSITSCLFAGRHGGRVVILVRRIPARDWVNEQVARMNRGVRLGTYREVPGIGERSFLYSIRASGAVLCIFGSEYYLQISLDGLVKHSQITTVLAKLARLSIQELTYFYSSSCIARGPQQMKKLHWDETTLVGTEVTDANHHRNYFFDRDSARPGVGANPLHALRRRPAGPLQRDVHGISEPGTRCTAVSTISVLGTIVGDWSGNFTRDCQSEPGCTTADQTVSGTLAANSDCTGSITYSQKINGQLAPQLDIIAQTLVTAKNSRDGSVAGRQHDLHTTANEQVACHCRRFRAITGLWKDSITQCFSILDNRTHIDDDV